MIESMAGPALSAWAFREGDIARLYRFLQECWWIAGAHGGYFHVGDLLWQRYMYEDAVVDPAERIRVWDGADGNVAGFAWYYPPAEAALNVHPRLRGEGAIEAAMLAWADERRRALAAGKSVGPLTASVFDGDAATAAVLAARGFARSGSVPMVCFARDLAEPIPAPALPDGFVVRPLHGDDEYEERVAIHREVWHPSRVTVPAYRRLRTVPGYDPDLDLVAVAPDGTFAAYAIVWPDPVNRTGEFEPVGTRAAFRRRGLARAILLEGLRRLRERGAELAVDYTNEDREPARCLYESVGFRVVDRWVNWERADAD
jgi:mycothiol synthase